MSQSACCLGVNFITCIAPNANLLHPTFAPYAELLRHKKASQKLGVEIWGLGAKHLYGTGDLDKFDYVREVSY